MGFQDSEERVTTMQGSKRRKGSKTMTVGHALLLLALLLLTVKGALALEITGTTVPSTITEGELLELSFTTDEPATYRILEDGVPVSATNAYQEQLGYDEAGLVTYTFEATATETVTEDHVIEILDAPLALTVHEPAKSDYTSTDIPVAVSTNIPADVCYTVTEAGTNTLLQQNSTYHNGTLSLTEGLQEITIKCDRDGEIAEETRMLRIDTTAPTVVVGPSGSQYDSVTLEVTTNEITTCRYGRADDGYAGLPNGFEGSGHDHREDLSLNEGTYTYYVACQDVYGNEAPTQSTTFTLFHKPKAEVHVEGENPHKAGQYEVTLEVSEPLQTVPTLTLTYQGGKSSDLALEEDDALTYKGYLIVEEDAGEQVGSFTFEGTDLDGLTGTRITEGELFIVDTVAPSKVESFKAENATEAVQLGWYYPSSEATSFRLYKATDQDVDYTDYYRTVSGSEYFDHDVGGVVRYYYRLAAIDEAGNIGPLSHVEWASAAPAALDKLLGALDPALVLLLERELEKLDIQILDAERIVQDLQAESGKERSWAIGLLNLIPEAQDGLKRLRQERETLEAWRGLSLTKEDFDRLLTEHHDAVTAARERLPITLAIEDQVDYEETADASDIERAVNKVLAGERYDDQEQASILEEATRLRGEVRILVTAAHLSITDASGDTRRLTLIEKQLLGQGLADLIGLERLPDDVAKQATFLEDKPLALDDRNVQYSFPTLTDERVAYSIPTIIDIPAVRASRLIVMPKPGTTTGEAELVPAEDEMLTGGVTSLLPGSLSNGEGVMILFGLLVVVGLLVYYFRIQDGALSGLAPAGFALGNASGAVMMPRQHATQPSTRTILVERTDVPLAGLLLKGHTLIDENRYADALFFYKKALERYLQDGFPSEGLRRAVYEELELLHAKLTLFSLSSRAHDMVYVDDQEGLMAVMHEMRDFAERVGERDTPLVTKAKHDYVFFYDQMNRMRLRAS